MLKSLTLIVLIVIAGVNSCSIEEADFNSVFADVDSVIRQANYEAMADAMFTMNVTFTSKSQTAMFLGTLKHNTRSLRSRQAECASTNTCSAVYNTRCNDKPDARTYFPRSGMMVAYKCGYETVNAIIHNRSVVAVADIMANPSIIADNMYYSYLASLAVWIDEDSNGTSCLSSTGNVTGLLSCIGRISPWECTSSGNRDKQNHAQSIAHAFNAMGIQVSSNEVVSAMCAAQPDQTETLTPTSKATSEPTSGAAVSPTSESTTTPTSAGSVAPTSEPTSAPTSAASVAPTSEPTTAPTSAASVAPTSEPTTAPTSAASVAPTSEPTTAPTSAASVAPTSEPTTAPTSAASVAPTSEPTTAPTSAASVAPVSVATIAPSTVPTVAPSPAPAALCNKTTIAPATASSKAPETPATTPACECVANSTAAPTNSASVAATNSPSRAVSKCPGLFPTLDAMADHVACNISFVQFASMFANASNASNVADHFSGFAVACNLTGIELDTNQASFVLGMIATSTNNLTAELPFTQISAERGFESFIAAAELKCGTNSSAMVANDKKTISYIAGLYKMKTVKVEGLTALQLASQMRFGATMQALNDQMCPSPISQLKTLHEVQRATVILGDPIPCDTIQLTICDDEMESSSTRTTPLAVAVFAILALTF